MAWLLAAALTAARPLRRWLNRAVVALYPYGLGRLVGGWLLVLTTTGRRTGIRRRTPLGYIRVRMAGCRLHRDDAADGAPYATPNAQCPTPSTEAFYVFRGAPTAADWLANVRARPEVQVMAGQQRLAARAEVLREPSARRAALVAYLHGTTPPARAARRRFGLDPRRPEPGLTRTVADPSCVLVALRYDREQDAGPSATGGALTREGAGLYW